MTTPPNPYAPPGSRVADAEPVSTGLKRRSILAMVIFTILTFGLYYRIWFIRRHAALNALNSPRTLLLWPFVLSIVIAVLNITVVASGLAEEPGFMDSAASMALSAAGVVSAILCIWQGFVVKDILQDHLTPDDPSSSMFTPQVQLSSLLTFFFQNFYLQYIINRDILSPSRTNRSS